MKRKLSISFLFLSMFVVLASGIIPHHHHADCVCTATAESCAHSHSRDNGNATNHENRSCVSKATFIAKHSKEDAKRKECSCNNHKHIHLFPVGLIAGRLLPLPAETPPGKPHYGKYLIARHTQAVNPAHALRAPPSLPA